MKSFINIGIIAALLSGNGSLAQNIYIGTDLSVKGTGSLYISGNFLSNSSATYINDGTVEIKGDISNDKAAMTQGAGKTMLTGTGVQTIAGTKPFVVNNLTINNTSTGTSNVVVNKNLIIGTSALFIDGIIESATDSVTFNQASTHSGSSDMSHINGQVKKIGNQAFTFPVGDGVKLRTAAITAPLVATDAFDCKYLRTNPNSIYLGTSMEATLDHISNCEYWMITKTAGTSDAYVTLSYDNVYSCGITDTALLFVSYLDDLLWRNFGHGAVLGTSSIGTIKATVLSSNWGAFTLGSSSIVNPLPIELLSFNAVYSDTKKGVDLKWETASEKNSDYYTIERSVNGSDWIAIRQVKAAGNSASVLIYSALDPAPVSGINFYRLKETDYNGDYFYSTIKQVNIASDVSFFSIFPNPTTANSSMILSTENDEEFQIEISNALGQILMKKNIVLMKGENQIPLETDSFEPGNYLIKIHSLNYSKSQTKKLMKLN